MVLVMEYAAGGELYDYLSEKKVLSESEARRIFRQVASACYYCHKVRTSEYLGSQCLLILSQGTDWVIPVASVCFCLLLSHK